VDEYRLTHDDDRVSHAMTIVESHIRPCPSSPSSTTTVVESPPHDPATPLAREHKKAKPVLSHELSGIQIMVLILLNQNVLRRLYNDCLL
jgi:hypothetical protein